MMTDDKGWHFKARGWWQQVTVLWRLLLLPALFSAVQPLQAQQPLTWELVHGRERLDAGTRRPVQRQWLDEQRWLQKTSSGWLLTDAATGTEQPWYDVSKVAGALQAVGLAAADAERAARGDWLALLPQRDAAAVLAGERLLKVQLQSLTVEEIRGVPKNPELAEFSPSGEQLAFVSGNELWVADFVGGTCRQLTSDASGAVRNGKADWVYFEEVYDRNWKAWKWSPDGSAIAFMQFDDTAVPLFRISDHAAVQQTIESEHYPKAGETNPLVKLGLVAVTGGPITWVDTGSFDPQDFILTHFCWQPGSDGLCWYAQNRSQTWLDVILTDRQGVSQRRLLRDQTAAWVDNPGDPIFLRDGSLLICSERSGYRHVYRVSADGSNVQAVTAGSWEVRAVQGLADDQASLLISATKDSPIAESLYRVSLTGGVTEPVRVTSEPGQHNVLPAPGGKWLLDDHSSLQRPPQTVLRSGDGAVVRVLAEGQSLPRDKYRFGTVELRPLPMADGSETSAIFVLPPDFRPDRRYPVWLRTYAGPHRPQVRDLWNPRLADHLLATQDIVVITFDPRSASGYSAASAWKAWRQLGVEETRDLVAVCDWLQQQSWADTSRIGLSGHSYGGYFTAYAMTHTDRIAAGIAGAPVTDWRHYDTIYTERFMGTPADNPDGYRKSSVTEAAAALRGRLLLVHGMLDDNVHPENTLELVHRLQQSEKQFELMLYPTARHPIVNSHYSRLTYNFIMQAMGRPQAVLAE